MTLTSPLREKSEIFQLVDSSNNGILDNVECKRIELYPAGYTQWSDRTQTNRQAAHQRVWEAAHKLGLEETLFPFISIDHTIELLPEPTNAYDKHAVLIILKVQNSQYQDLNNLELGYVPRKISKEISENIHLINNGKIYKVRSKYHDRYYTTKITLEYNHVHTVQTNTMQRFIDILDEE